MSISKICMHWTAGSNNPCQTDIDAYHFIFDSAGKEFKGKFESLEEAFASYTA